jgi:hypothetical protein
MDESTLTEWMTTVQDGEFKMGEVGVREGFIIRPGKEQGRLVVHYYEFCPVREKKYMLAVINRGWQAMTALHLYLRVNHIKFALNVDSKTFQPYFVVNHSSRDEVTKQQLNYYYALHRDGIHMSEQTDFQTRMTDDGK